MPVKYINHPTIDKLKSLFGLKTNVQLAKKLGMTEEYISILNCEKSSMPERFNSIIEAYRLGLEKENMQITQDTSDGYHTFRELYEHRRILTQCLFNLDYKCCFKSKLHDDGTMFDDYFIVGIKTKDGLATYHYHLDFWDNFKCSERCNAPAWDGHTGQDAINRISGHFKDSVILRK